MRTKRVLRAAVAFLFAFGVLAADLTPLRLPPQTASAVTQELSSISPCTLTEKGISLCAEATRSEPPGM